MRKKSSVTRETMINKELEKRHWTLADYAAHVGCAASSICRYITGQRVPDVFTAHRMATVLGMNPIDFWDDNG